MLQNEAHQRFWHFNPVRDRWITDEILMAIGSFVKKYGNLEKSI